MKAVIYARYSSDNQREESIEGQLRECNEYATYNDIQVVGTYIDRALTAKTDNRPQFQQMIKDSYRMGFELIIVWKLDRFARNRFDSAHYKALLKKNGVKVISATETISEGAEGILLESMLEGYACVRQKKHLCDKKMVPKEKLENFVVYRTMGLLKEDSVIDELSARLYDLQYRESTLIPQLEQQLKDKEREISNIIEAIQNGANSPTLTKRLNELELQKSEIETAIVKEQIKRPTYSQNEYRMALTNYRKIDITTQEGKRKIIDTFINAIFVYDDHIKIIYNGKNKEECVTLEELEGSTLFSSGAPQKTHLLSTKRCVFLTMCSVFAERDAHFVRDVSFGSDVCLRQVKRNASHH